MRRRKKELLSMEGWTTIRYLQAQGKSIHVIAKEMGVTRKVVRRALRSEGPPGYERAKRTNPKIEPFLAQIRELHFTKHLIGTRILREIQAKGYSGGRTALYVYLRGLKQPQLSGKVTMRFETEPGQQAQFDWSPYTIELGGELRRVVIYGMTLGFSRRKHYTASLDERQGSIFEAIEACLWHFGGYVGDRLSRYS
jgi:transposase